MSSRSITEFGPIELPFGTATDIGLSAELGSEVWATATAVSSQSYAKTPKLHDLLSEYIGQYLHEDCGLLKIRGVVPKDIDIGPTPSHWKGRLSQTEEETVCNRILLSVSRLLGEIVSFSSIQDGNIISDILPVKGHEGLVAGTNSVDPLLWHTEECAAPFRPRYQVFLCMRNPDRIGTIVSGVRRCSAFSDEEWNVLSAENFETSASEVIGWKHFEKHALVDLERHQIRLDRVYTYALSSSDEDLLQRLFRLVDRNSREICLAKGDLLVIDNHRFVHGRAAFRSRYDGSDRWIKRVKVIADALTLPDCAVLENGRYLIDVERLPESARSTK